MKFDDSDDEYGFWEPERPRRQTSPRSGRVVAAGPRRSTADEPTRQLRRISPDRTSKAEPRRWRVSDVEPTQALRHDVPSDARSDESAAYLEELSALLDHDVAVAMGDDVPLVPVTTRRSLRSRLRREDGRIDPFAARLGVLLLVGLVAIPIGAGLSGGSDAPSAVRPATASAAPSTVAPSSAAATSGDVVAGGTEAGSAPAAAGDVQTPVASTSDAAAHATGTASTGATATAGASASSGGSASAAATVDQADPTPDASKQEALLKPVSKPVCSSSYTLVAGDYWLGIADRADVKLGALLQANGATSSTPLYPGRTICLPAGATTPLPPASTTAASTSVVPASTAPATSAAAVPAATAPKSSTTTPTTTSKTTAPKTTTAASTVPKTTTPAATTPKTTTPKTTTPKTSVPKSTSAPTTAAPTTLPQRSYSRDEVAQIIRDVWPDDLEDKAVAIATRESNLQPEVRNFCCFGLFQIYYSVHQGWLSGIGITSADQLYDPTNNAKAALALYYRDGGWGPWGG